jgi:glycosyltransferase involved in cell wall biosynthesis
MKIAYITTNFYALSESFVRDLAVGLSQQHELKVFANKITDSGLKETQVNSEACNFSEHNGRVERVGSFVLRRVGCDADTWILNRRQRRFNKRLEGRLELFAPDVIYADYGTNGIFLKKIAENLQKPLVVHFHGFDLSSELKYRWYMNGLKDLVGSDAQLIVPSEHMKRLLVIATGVAKNVNMIPCAPDLNIVQTLKGTKKPNVPTVSVLGRMTAKKTPLALIEAFRLVREAIPDVQINWVGDGELIGAARERIKTHKLQECIHLFGGLKHQEALKVIANSHVFAQHSVTAPSGDQEGLPVSILEALALGIPVVSTIHSGIPEAVIDGVNGFLVREHDYPHMAQRLIEILGKNKAFPEWSGSNDFSLSKRLEKIEAIFNFARLVS